MSSVNMKSTAAANIPNAAALANPVPPSVAEKNRQLQREMLMEKIRSRASQQKSFAELAKTMRLSMLEKRYALDSVEKSNLQKCLDSMQYCIKVTTRQGLVERLESLSRQLGLKFMEDTSGLFISTDMFYLEIMLDTNGALTDVKVHHECKIEQQSCSELVNCLKRGDFADFTVQLEGLSSIYQLNAEPKVKTKAFVALQAMETDLYNLFQIQNFTDDLQHLVKESTVGVVLKRRGGHPMKMVYFVPPYDLISLETKSFTILTTEMITKNDIGLSVTVNLEASSANKLQILPIISITKDPQTGAEMPIYEPLTPVNSMLLPATFVLRLNKPIPVCYATLCALGLAVSSANDVSGMDSQPQAKPAVSTIMNLVVQTASEQLLKNSNKGLFISLLDQTHCYFFSENEELKASLVTSVPFTEPTQVPKILDFLKKQALFYTLLASCVRPRTKMGNDMDTTTMVEVSAISFQKILVSLQHTYEEFMATVEFDLSDENIKCKIFYLNHNYDFLSVKLTKIVGTSLSIPVTIRALLKYWEHDKLQKFHNTGTSNGMGGTTGTPNNGFGNYNLAMGANESSVMGGNNGGIIGGRNLKMESNVRQQMQNMSGMVPTTGAITTTSGVGPNVAGFLKYKNDIQQEDFLESPKSHSNTPKMQCVDTNSLGQHQQQQLPMQEQQHSAKVSDIEIADKYKNIWKDKTPNLKNCVSITPISPENNRVTQQNLDAKRTVGIEIIPLTAQSTNVAGGNGNTAPAVCTTQTTGTSSTITITPINSSSVSSVASSSKEKKMSSSAACVGVVSSNLVTSNSNKRTIDSVIGTVPISDSQKEKKRKKKRDDSPMGPPEKVFSRQNSPASTCDASASVVGRKFSSPSSSPKGGSGSMLGSSTSTSSLLSTRPSPKHSPVYSSPKHTNTASNSPKSPFGTHSPKHGSSGKPSMSTLKSAAATSLSPKGDKSVSLSATASALSAAAAAGVAAANAVKSAMGVGNMQQMKSLNHLGVAASMNAAGVFSSGSSLGGSSLAGGTGVDVNAAAMRKVATGAVSLTGPMKAAAPATSTIATPNDVQPTQLHQQQQQLQQQQPSQTIGSSETTVSSSSGMLSESSSATEYMVKSSQEGLKLTINKTNTKSSASSASVKSKGNNSSSSSVANSSGGAGNTSTVRKQHTGLKPGVHSGPASKRSAVFNSGNNSTTSSPTKSTVSKHVFQKSNSSGNLSAKLSSASTVSSTVSSSAGGLNKSSSSSSNTFSDSGSSTARKSVKKSSNTSSSTGVTTSTSLSQPATRMDHHADMMKILQYASPAMAANMEGFMKGLNSKFQIPKLSQRAAANATMATAATSATTVSSSTYSHSAPTTPTNLSPPISAAYAGGTISNPSAVTTAVAKTTTLAYGQQHFASDSHAGMLQDHLKTDDRNSAHTTERSPPPPYHTSATTGSTNSTNHGMGMTLPVVSQTPPPPSLPPSGSALQQSSVSVHIMKSPVSSPLMNVLGVGGNEMLHQHQHHYHQPHVQQQHQPASLDFLNNESVSSNAIDGVSSSISAGLAE